MAWRDDMRPGSFRGVPFLVAVTAQDETGRRAEIHQYPQRDTAWVEDLGRKTEPFSIEATIIGVNYLADAERLYRACGEAGPGQLVHPWAGTRSVFCLSAKRTYSTSQGGSAQFSLTFVDAGENRTPGNVIDSQAGVRGAADSASNASVGDFTRIFSTAGRPGFVAANGASLVRRLADRLGALALPGSRSLGLPGAEFARDLVDLRSGADGLVGSPADLATTLIGNLTGFGNLFATPRLRAVSFRSLNLFGRDFDPVPATTPSRLAEGQNQDALIGLVQRQAVIGEARATSEIEFDSFDEAAQVRDSLAARLDETAIAAADAGDDASFETLTRLRAATVRDISVRGADLRRLARLTPVTTRPALALSWALYGDDPTLVQDRADDIARRNRIAHPGFVTGGRQIEVLSNG
jgi:prophage DNA circulation protein